ncbi:hypothetical protein MTO96_009856 [Rhipicephalus appendiculatus]
MSATLQREMHLDGRDKGACSGDMRVPTDASELGRLNSAPCSVVSRPVAAEARRHCSEMLLSLSHGGFVSGERRAGTVLAQAAANADARSRASRYRHAATASLHSAFPPKA